ncbi:MAG: hypothetical protein DRJ15_08695 [Bacteroidetes bacterium]|nr:MAG: hypothetical protein DRJ15_08695 [Bacteroidota bacterium]
MNTTVDITTEDFEKALVDALPEFVGDNEEVIDVRIETDKEGKKVIKLDLREILQETNDKDNEVA